ncbi:MAG: amidohydrolase family protein [Alphaproteobacteria bacterium]
MSKQPTGIGFVGCDLQRSPADNGAHSHDTAQGHTHRQEVSINGTRITTVDIHAHCAVPEALAVLDLPCEKDTLLMSDPAERIAAMDSQGIDISALSINPYWYHAERDAAAELIRIQNEGLAEICAANPDRFVAFATIALQHPELAVEQIEYGVKQLGLRGVSIGCEVEGEELADPRFDPVWAKCDELDLLVFMHPKGTPSMVAGRRLSGSGVLQNTIGNPLDTTIALSHLIFEGTLDRHPGLKICAVHGGGYFASYAHRSDAVIRTFPQRVGPLPKKNPTQYLKDGQLYFDTIVFDPEALNYLISQTGSDKIMIGTDYPYGWTSTEVELVMRTPGLTDDERIAILGGTAAKLLGLDR